MPLKKQRTPYALSAEIDTVHHIFDVLRASRIKNATGCPRIHGPSLLSAMPWIKKGTGKPLPETLLRLLIAPGSKTFAGHTNLRFSFLAGFSSPFLSFDPISLSRQKKAVSGLKLHENGDFPALCCCGRIIAAVTRCRRYAGRVGRTSFAHPAPALLPCYLRVT